MQELDSAALRRLHRMIFIVRAVLFWEKLWPRLWPFLILASLFISAILFDLFRGLSPSVHILLLGVSGLALIASFAYGFVGLSYPGKVTALHKIEKDSQLNHQPLFALLDHPVGIKPDKQSETIWLNHQDRMVSALQKATVKFPRSELYKRDPYSLRAALIILLLLGAIEARFDYKDRLARAFAPTEQFGIASQWKLEAWINPPAYSGLGPIFLSANQDSKPADQPLSILQHSELLIRLEGRRGRDEVTLSTGPFVENFQNLSQGTFSLETTIDQAQEIKILRNNKPVFRWPVNLIIDQPPEITLNGPPQSGFRGHMNIGYHGLDDFGLKEVQLIIRPLVPDGRADLILSQEESERDVKGRFRHNLADHPWAGQEVIVTPVAIDSADQIARGPALKFTLPERQFSHPLALRLITIRKNLAENTPDAALHSREWLEMILDHPEDFDHDHAIYLPLKVAADRLGNHADDRPTDDIRAILWETAVRLEEGASGSARNQLEFMSRQMREMMQNLDDKAAMEALFEQMQKSLDQFLQKMGQTMPDMNDFQEALGPQNGQMIGRDELMDLLNKARELMRAGDAKAAQAVMDQFQSILSRLAMQKQADAQQMKAARELIQKLREIQDGQQNLLDRTFQRSRGPNNSSIRATKDAIREAVDQAQLLEDLKAQIEALQKMGAKAPDSLQSAGREMKAATDGLERGLDEVAIQAQSRALDHLRKGLSESAQQLAQQMGMQNMPQQMPGYDPLGRRSGKGPLNSETGNTVPTEAEIKQSREILKELYRRAGQKGRAEQELKYIERLLDRF